MNSTTDAANLVESLAHNGTFITLKEVKSIIASSSTSCLDEQDSGGRTAAMVAIGFQRVDLLEELIQENTNVRLKDNNSSTILDIAILGAHLDTLRATLASCSKAQQEVLLKGGETSATDKCLSKPAKIGFAMLLLLTSEFGMELPEDVIGRLCNSMKYFNISYPNDSLDDNPTLDILSELLEMAINEGLYLVDPEDTNSLPLLHLLCALNSPVLLRRCLAALKNNYMKPWDDTEFVARREQLDANNRTPLTSCCIPLIDFPLRQGSTRRSCAEALLDEGAFVEGEAQPGFFSFRPLMHCTSGLLSTQSQQEVGELLVQRGADTKSPTFGLPQASVACIYSFCLLPLQAMIDTGQLAPGDELDMANDLWKAAIQACLHRHTTPEDDLGFQDVPEEERADFTRFDTSGLELLMRNGWEHSDSISYLLNFCDDTISSLGLVAFFAGRSDLNHIVGNQMSVLFMAVLKESSALVKLFLRNGASADFRFVPRVCRGEVRHRTLGSETVADMLTEMKLDLFSTIVVCDVCLCRVPLEMPIMSCTEAECDFGVCGSCMTFSVQGEGVHVHDMAKRKGGCAIINQLTFLDNSLGKKMAAHGLLDFSEVFSNAGLTDEKLFAGLTPADLRSIGLPNIQALQQIFPTLSVGVRI